MYSRWCSTKDRYLNPSSKNYPSYGGRGIGMCDEWKNDFWQFVEDIGLPPTPDHTIDRINNEKGYSPDNCRWATKAQQTLNRRVKPTSFTGKKAQKERKKEWQKEYHKKTYQRRELGWWRENFGIYENPYVYGPMPWKQTSRKHRLAEAVERGWHIPRNN